MTPTQIEAAAKELELTSMLYAHEIAAIIAKHAVEATGFVNGEGRVPFICENTSRAWWIGDSNSTAKLFHDGVWRDDMDYTDSWPSYAAAEAFLSQHADQPTK